MKNWKEDDVQLQSLFLEDFDLERIINVLEIYTGETKLVDLLKRKDWTSISIFKAKLTEFLKTYYYVGGMPEVVSAYIHDRDWKRVRRIQKSILLVHEADFSKHAPGNILARIRMVWQSVAAQLAKENKKFIYGSLNYH